jgi:hypothetical protein
MVATMSCQVVLKKYDMTGNTWHDMVLNYIQLSLCIVALLI